MFSGAMMNQTMPGEGTRPRSLWTDVREMAWHLARGCVRFRSDEFNVRRSKTRHSLSSPRRRYHTPRHTTPPP